DCLRLRVAQTDVVNTLGAWPLLARLADHGIAWARQLGDQSWPKDVQDQMRIVLADAHRWESGWLISRLANLLPQVPPSSALSLLHDSSALGQRWEEYSAASLHIPIWIRAARWFLTYRFRWHIKCPVNETGPCMSLCLN